MHRDAEARAGRRQRQTRARKSNIIRRVARSLSDWLEYIEKQHPSTIALGLERVGEVLGRLGAGLACPVITVGGTNGKGSTCAMLESILRAAGYRTGLYTSPHLVRYNERVRIAGAEAGDEALSAGFAAVEAARGGAPLTYFEFGTLAAFWVFNQMQVEAAVLEVGLGGRLDAVNAVDADCAVLTSVAIDHVDYLGSTRESIGREKAGIFRSGRPAVVADPDPPASVLNAGTHLLLINRDFGYTAEASQWAYWGPGGKRGGLAHPALRGAIQLRNAAAALCALDTLRERLPVAMQEVRRGLAEVTLPARFEVLPGRPQVILDVAHNVEAAQTLERNLAASGFAPEIIAVCGMLRDKDVGGVLRELAPRITRWHLASLPGPRAAAAGELATQLAALGVARASMHEHASPAQAFAAARESAGENDKLVVFGSFLTVGEVKAWLSDNKTSKR
jgi:dihydrofolate synthase / folylpolyglutamate synthase